MQVAHLYHHNFFLFVILYLLEYLTLVDFLIDCCFIFIIYFVSICAEKTRGKRFLDKMTLRQAKRQHMNVTTGNFYLAKGCLS